MKKDQQYYQKEFNSEPIYNKKYLKAEKKILQIKDQHERKLSMYLYINNVDWFTIYKK